MEVEDIIIRLQSLAHIIGRIEGRRKPPHARHHGLSEPVGSLLFASHIETSQELAARPERTQDLGICLLLVGKHMEPIHAEYEVERPIPDVRPSSERQEKGPTIAVGPYSILN